MDRNSVNGRIARLCAWLRAGKRDERGATAVFFAVGLVLLAPATLGLVDVYMITTQRGQLQEALDTATLYAARSNKMTTEDIQIVGDNALRANLKLPEGQELTSSTFTLSDKGKVTGHATIDPPNIGPRLWAQADIEANSEVLRNSNNVEVALVLDTTGSMSGEMDNLRTAAKDLVDLVVQDKQTPYYTKAALVPYSVGVKLGGYADAARGTLAGPTAIQAVRGQDSKVVIQSTAHGLNTGDQVELSSVSGVKLDGSQIKGTYTVTWISNDEFSLNGAWSGNLSGSYKGGGKAQCLREGCLRFRFQDATRSHDWQTFGASDCASERIGSEAYTDAGPSVSFVGRVYGACGSGQIVPLSSDKTMLKNKIDALTSNGSTAGQIGVGWGWYMVSPEWGSLWPDASSAPAPYSTQQLLKVVVLMTDGAFNSPYCKGVVAADAGSGSGSASDHINCNATNGDPFSQAEKMCAAMKAKGITVYTVGFNVSSDADVQNVMRNCATSPDFVYFPEGGTALKIAFRAIAQDINSLRISK
ncbi:TadE/TadG family type IV pilus assembly protein [Phenylobacterium koreense]|uniref:Flp pilus assembly protein TadG n=1 Tax=Phenylobacterium koreense TaxID=266125 RepID=A0ABV2EJP7_9CAUL